MDRNFQGEAAVSRDRIYSFLDVILQVFSELEEVRTHFSGHLNTDVVLLQTKFIQVIDDTQRLIADFEREMGRPLSSTHPPHQVIKSTVNELMQAVCLYLINFYVWKLILVGSATVYCKLGCDVFKFGICKRKSSPCVFYVFFFEFGAVVCK